MAEKPSLLPQLVYWSLRAGVSIGALFLAAGVAAWTLGRPEQHLLRIGILFILATPLCRVAVLGAGYAHRREWRFAAVSLAVLLLLTASILFGPRG